MVELAQKQGIAPAQIALVWVLHQPGATAPIIGASKMNHFKVPGSVTVLIALATVGVAIAFL